MTTETQPQIKEFQSETKQVLRLVIHSLYSHKEIFLRELISNASDACEKLRFEALATPGLLGEEIIGTLSGDSAKDALLIGQFGVGFYSAFIVADKVTVLTKRTDSAAVRWDSDGEGQYEIQSSDKTDRGT